jgi:thioredoxin reductase (NADPH)
VSASRPSIVDTRRDQIFPVLETGEIERARRFGDVRRFSTGEALASVGRIGEGLAIILEGQVEVYRYDARGERQHFYTFGPGSFLGELAQLGGRPSFGDAIAREPVKVLNFPPDRMRALLIGEAELGERLMRALIRADLVRNATAHPDPAKARPATGPRFRETLAGSARHLS